MFQLPPACQTSLQQKSIGHHLYILLHIRRGVEDEKSKEGGGEEKKEVTGDERKCHVYAVNIAGYVNKIVSLFESSFLTLGTVV